VILRVVSGRVPPGELDNVVESFRRDYEPVARRTSGLDRFAVGARALAAGSHELAALTLWASVESALEAYGGKLSTVRTIDGKSHGERLERVEYYEIDDDAARRRPGSAAHLRLTSGRVARGQDADIQKELRGRLADLPAEAIEAYVGRRVHGADVEIAFVSLWSGVPPGVALDAPLFPTIADRYDEFRIALLDVLLEGAGAA
jgi:hypothetical protein